MTRTTVYWMLALLLCAATRQAAHAAPDKPQSPIGEKVAPFSLQDYRGKVWRLGDFDDSKLLVVAYLGTECPLAKLYGPRLDRLAEEYASRGVGFVGVNANSQDSITEIAAYARRHGIDFPLLKDPGNRVADAMGAVRTPEVFLLDEDRTVRYWGRVDDQYGVGYIRDEPRRRDLKIALDELLAGKPVSRPVEEAVGCFIGRVQEPNADSDVTYADQISRILQRRCVECHRSGEIAPFSLTDYDEVVGWAETIAEVVRDGRMPPWHASPEHGQFRNERQMPEEEKQAIYRWVAQGAPLGDPDRLPEPPMFTAGWQLPEAPDLVLDITEEPFTVPAEGAVKYQYFQVDPGFKEDKWIRAAELRPGNRRVVHHILAFARSPDGEVVGAGGGAGGYLVGYVPGLRTEPFPQGMAKRIPAGSRLVFQMHYTPVGSEQQDRSQLGLIFADPEEIEYEVVTTSAVQRRLNIPPHAGSHEVSAISRRASPEGALLLSMMPHMHLRGKSFRYVAEYPSGAEEILLDVPAYDFNWQTSYRLAEPKPLPEGTRLRCVAHYDNSEENLNNPDPSATVGWGDQTWNEMMIGYFNLAVPRERSAGASLPR